MMWRLWAKRLALPAGLVVAMVAYSAFYGGLLRILLGASACALIGAVAGALGGAIPHRSRWGAADGACLGAIIGAGAGARMGLEWLNWRMVATLFLLTGFFGLCMADPPTGEVPASPEK
ncbi:MAG TPA: hypothetical protein PLU39_03900 [Armatimonadota bacterium]|nr:hypothetical protein [Armatimonadota bacterium]